MTRPGEPYPVDTDASADPDPWWFGADPDGEGPTHGVDAHDVGMIDGEGPVPDLGPHDDLPAPGHDGPRGSIWFDDDDEPAERPRHPIRWPNFALGAVAPTAVFAGFEGGLSALLLRQSEGAGLTTLLVWLPLGILGLSLLTAIAAVVARRRGARGLSLGLLVGLVPALVVGGAVSLAVLDAGTGLG